ncbi:MAG TPA: acyltransferase family protein, partial [Pirellula sp.]|nr:acyltransferase family protein [Pirellula sp.]
MEIRSALQHARGVMNRDSVTIGNQRTFEKTPDAYRQEPKRFYLDSMRGMAAIIVIATHFLQAFYPYAVFGGDYRQQASFESVFHWPPFSLVISGNFAVCLFFVLSGFVLTTGHMQFQSQSRRRLIKAMIKRPIRLGGMVAFSVLISYAMLTCGCYFSERVSLLTGSRPWFSSFWTHSISIKAFACDLIFGLFSTSEAYNPPMWTIYKELKGSYIVFLYLLFRVHLQPMQRAILLAALFFLLYKSLYVGFVFGLAFAELDRLPWMDKLRASRVIAPLMLCLGLLLGMQPYYLHSVDAPLTGLLATVSNFGTGGYSMFGAILVFASVLSSVRIQHALDRRVLRYVGSVSYAMYALHFLLLGSLASWLYLNLIGS